MKRIYAIFLIVALLGPFTGTLTFFVIQKQQIRRDLKHKTGPAQSGNGLILFKICASRISTELQWKDTREFVFEGHMYDVISQTQSGDTILLRCYKDHAETRLHRQFTKMISDALGDNPARKDRNERLISYYKSFCTDPPHGNDLFVPEITRDGAHGEREVFYQSLFSSPPIPPPKES